MASAKEEGLLLREKLAQLQTEHQALKHQMGILKEGNSLEERVKQERRGEAVQALAEVKEKAA